MKPWLAVVVVLALGACAAHPAKTAAESASAVSDAGMSYVRGQIGYPQRIALPPSAIVRVQLLEVPPAGGIGVVLAEQHIELKGRQVPVPFEVCVDRSRIRADRHYLIQARIHDGENLRFVSTDTYRVLTDGVSDTLDVVVWMP